jgi:hypothetical protein
MSGVEWQLRDLAQVIRSKNAGPYEITFDVMFKDPELFCEVRDRASSAAS